MYNPLIRVKRSKDGFLDNLKIKDNLDLDAEMVKPTTNIYVFFVFNKMIKFFFCVLNPKRYAFSTKLMLGNNLKLFVVNCKK